MKFHYRMMLQVRIACIVGHTVLQYCAYCIHTFFHTATKKCAVCIKYTQLLFLLYMYTQPYHTTNTRTTISMWYNEFLFLPVIVLVV